MESCRSQMNLQAKKLGMFVRKSLSMFKKKDMQYQRQAIIYATGQFPVSATGGRQCRLFTVKSAVWCLLVMKSCRLSFHIMSITRQKASRLWQPTKSGLILNVQNVVVKHREMQKH